MTGKFEPKVNELFTLIIRKSKKDGGLLKRKILANFNPFQCLSIYRTKNRQIKSIKAINQIGIIGDFKAEYFEFAPVETQEINRQVVKIESNTNKLNALQLQMFQVLFKYRVGVLGTTAAFATAIEDTQDDIFRAAYKRNPMLVKNWLEKFSRKTQKGFSAKAL